MKILISFATTILLTSHSSIWCHGFTIPSSSSSSLPSCSSSSLSFVRSLSVTCPSSKTYSKPSSSKSTSSLARMASISVSEDSERHMEGFEGWATTYGVQRGEGIELYNENEEWNNYGLMTTTDLSGGETVMAIPAEMILTATSAKEELEAISENDTVRKTGIVAAADQLNRIGSGASVPQFYLFVKILLEYERGEDSPYLPWLDALPRLYLNAVSMTDFCYECLPPLVFRLARDERVKFDNFFEVLKKVDIISPAVKQDRDICKWAFNVVFTRCFGSTQEQRHSAPDVCIIPMADMLNHGTDTEVDISFDEMGNCNVYTTQDVPANSPLRLSYGCPSNPSFFFATYGFLDESSPATFCKMMTIQPTPENKDLGYDFSRMLFYKDTGDIAQEVWDVVLHDKVLKNNLDMKQQFYQAHMNGDEDTKNSIHQQYMLETITEIKTHVDTFLKQIDELSAKGNGKDYHEHPRLPLILNHNEFVKIAFLNVKAKLDPMFEEYGGQVEALGGAVEQNYNGFEQNYDGYNEGVVDVESSYDYESEGEYYQEYPENEFA